MQFKELKSFLESGMRMSHIYQPVMIKELLLHGGRLSDESIAKSLLAYDKSQIEYYQRIVNGMVGKVLRGRNVVEKAKEYSLNGYDSLTAEQREMLIQICEAKISAYITKHGESPWAHRDHRRTAISGSIRYEVLKRAQFRCELCGISAEDKALEVDHIVPKSTGGEDSINNYQALCYTCNASKRNTDSADFRNLSSIYHEREQSCIFCSVEKSRILAENNLAYAIYDAFPVSSRHALIIPKRHTPDYFQLGASELNAVNALTKVIRNLISESDTSVTGFNVGINVGAAAGQTIFHCHQHLIPRRNGDVADPKGGIRHTIPGKGHY